MLHIGTLLAAAGLAAGVLFGAAAPARAGGDTADLMKARNSERGDPAKIRALEDRLRQAERASAERRSRETAAPADGVEPAPAAPAQQSAGGAKPSAALVKTDGADEAEKAADAEPAEPAPVVRPGCMYAGTKLIWERTPGTCHD